MMIDLVLPVYGLAAFVSRKDRAAMYVALSFFAIELGHGFCDFDYSSIHYLSIAILTLIPVRLCRFLEKEKRSKMIASCLGLVTIYMTAWICSEAGLPESQFKWPHIAILIYQFGVLHGGTGVLDGLSNLLANASKYFSRLRLRYDSGN